VIEIALNRNRWQFLQPAQAGFVCIGAISIARFPSPIFIAHFHRPHPIARIRSPNRNRCQSPLRHIYQKLGFFSLKFPLSLSAVWSERNFK
jgi:hypothetical protein